ncbi:c-type cytochrome [Leptolyngbya cf. ectocarpi LEGE 11479]|uniref:C-type cytochrome n=1 Tax=Leptolyngbya cf. ectocarpi LEGE 11479 TaxID=1828722 RepID=A0A929F7S3_LEPEC|nr:c-type cytochrome [Leptolyngbya ectocarpi]MBE9068885.1 c-type cytochrome [Leptolyngbya cf. ectocarpi LEGE 11479]
MLRSLFICCLVVSLWVSTPAIVWADNPSPASPPATELFEVHCAGCHPNGANIIRRGKNLKQKALKRHGYDSAAAISTLITNGKGLMSAYGDRLSPEEIDRLANYVLDQAALNWKSS